MARFSTKNLASIGFSLITGVALARFLANRFTPLRALSIDSAFAGAFSRDSAL